MLGGDNDLSVVRIGDKIHGTAHAFEDLAGDHVVGEVTIRADLESLQPPRSVIELLKDQTVAISYPENGYIDMPATDHAERLGRVETGGARYKGHCLLASVYDVAAPRQIYLVRTSRGYKLTDRPRWRWDTGPCPECRSLTGPIPCGLRESEMRLQ